MVTELVRFYRLNVSYTDSFCLLLYTNIIKIFQDFLVWVYFSFPEYTREILRIFVKLDVWTNNKFNVLNDETVNTCKIEKIKTFKYDGAKKAVVAMLHLKNKIPDYL